MHTLTLPLPLPAILPPIKPPSSCRRTSTRGENLLLVVQLSQESYQSNRSTEFLNENPIIILTPYSRMRTWNSSTIHSRPASGSETNSGMIRPRTASADLRL
jgi:hypothetical protein